MLSICKICWILTHLFITLKYTELVSDLTEFWRCQNLGNLLICTVRNGQMRLVQLICLFTYICIYFRTDDLSLTPEEEKKQLNDIVKSFDKGKLPR